MKKNEMIKILKEGGWHETDGIPKNFSGIDYHTHEPSYNRIILFGIDLKDTTEKRLRYLMNTPVERRR